MKKQRDSKQIIRPITVNIEAGIWEEFKSKVTRDKTLNESVVNLIKEYNERR